MRILIVSQYFWPESFSINSIAKYLVEQGHEVDVLTGIPNYPTGKTYDGYGLFRNRNQHYNGITIRRVWMKTRGQKGGDKRLVLNYLSFAINASFAVLGRIRKKYDVSFVYGMSPITQAYPAMLLRKLKKKPLCLYVGDLWPDTLFSHGLSGKRVQKALTKACISIYKQSDFIIAVNESFMEPLKAYTNNSRLISYVPQAVEKMYKPLVPIGYLRHDLGLNDSSFIIMFAGNIGFAQSPMTVVEAAHLITDKDDIHFVFVGDGSKRKECEVYCEENELTNVHFIGKKNVDQMPGLIAEADAMLVTLKNQPNYNLTLPGRTQAYMACGKPILCCANGETARVIKNSCCGLIAEAENSKKLAEIIIDCYSMSKEERDELGRRGLEYSNQHYDMAAVMNKIEEILMSIKYEK